MLKQFLVTFSLALFLVAPMAAQAQSANEALARMDAIIAEMQKLRAEFAKLANTTTAAPTPAVLGAQTSAVFTHSLEYGETNDDIKRIQTLLATDPEIYPYGVASGFFGPKTEEAINNLQARNGWDPVGVIGPATRKLLEDYFRTYPDENWPADVLKSAPPAAPQGQVQGVSLSSVVDSLSSTQATPASSDGNPANRINVTLDDGEALVEVLYTNGNRKGFVFDTDDRDEVVTMIASRTVLSEAQVRDAVRYNARDDDDDDDEDEEDAEDALEDAEDAIDEAEEAIEEADEDGDDVDWAEDTLDEAEEALEEAEEAFDDEDWDEAEELAEEAEKLANRAEDRIDEDEDDNDRKGDPDEIEEIQVEVDEGESEVTVEYEDGDEYEFTVEEDSEDDIIEEVADELNIDEDEVEDVIEFDYGDIDEIKVRIDDDDSLVRIFYESGVERRIRVDETDEDDIIEAIADELDEDEDDVEDWIDFE